MLLLGVGNGDIGYDLVLGLVSAAGYTTVYMLCIPFSGAALMMVLHHQNEM